MRRTVALCAIAMLCCAWLDAVPTLAASYTWGYGYARTRTTEAPVAADAAAVPGNAAGALRPFVVPLPGRSQSTPVVAGGRWYMWTYWDGGRRGALWTGWIDAATATSTPGKPVDLPGQGGPVLRASPGERFDEPSDAAISPDGRWVAFAAGDTLYWWPVGKPRAGGSARITGTGPVAGSGSSPTFVPDPAAPSGWAVCDGNWDGGFACYGAMASDGTAPVELAGYESGWAGGRGAPITSSAALGTGGRLYFGVASSRDPRLVQVDFTTGAWRVLLGPLSIRAPIWSATAVEGGQVFATDVEGNIYRVPAGGGAAQVVVTGAGSLIEPPTVTPHHVLLVSPSRDALFTYDWAAEGGTAWVDLGSGGTPGTPTWVGGAGARPEIFVGRSGGGFTASALTWNPQPSLRPLLGAAAPAPNQSRFSAVVVDGPEVLLWAGAVSSGTGPGAPAPQGAGIPASAGGLEVYGLVPRLTAALVPPGVTVGSGQARLEVLAPVGARASVAWQGGATGTLQPALAADPCPAGWMAEAGPNVGAVAGTGGGTPPGGCGPDSAGASLTAALQQAAGNAQPAAEGTSPAQWAAAGARFLGWQAEVPSPTQVGASAVQVTATMPDGRSTTVTVWLAASCPAGETPAAAGQCSAAAGQPVAAAGAACATNGMSAAEQALVCGVLAPWLSDGKLAACWSSWWTRVEDRNVGACGAVGGSQP